MQLEHQTHFELNYFSGSKVTLKGPSDLAYLNDALHFEWEFYKNKGRQPTYGSRTRRGPRSHSLSEVLVKPSC